MIFYLTIFIAFLWLGIETSWLTLRLPCGALGHATGGLEPLAGSEPLANELPYDIFYADSDFYDDGDDLSWNHTEAEYRAWLDKEREPRTITLTERVFVKKYREMFIDRTVDYPQDRYLDDIEAQDRRRNGEEIYQRGNLRIRG